MAAAACRRSSGPVIRSLSQSGRFSAPTSSYHSAGATSSSTDFTSSSSSFAAHPSTFFRRSVSPTRVNLGSPAASPSVRFSFDSSRSVSSASRPSHRQVTRSAAPARQSPQKRRSCMCSPTTHPGSFRCALHKNAATHSSSSHSFAAPSNRLNARRSAITNSLVRSGTVEGDLVKRALIRPSSHHLRRRAAFQPRPSRLSIMSRAADSDLP